MSKKQFLSTQMIEVKEKILKTYSILTKNREDMERLMNDLGAGGITDMAVLKPRILLAFAQSI